MLTKFTVVDSVPTANGIAGIGTDGKFAYNVSHDDGSTTLYDAGTQFPETEQYALDDIAGTNLVGEEQLNGGTWRGHLDFATSKIVVDKVYTGCVLGGAAKDGTFCNNYLDASGNVTRIAIVSPTGTETDLLVPSPKFVTDFISHTMAVGELETNPALAAKARSKVQKAAGPSLRPATATRGTSSWMLITKTTKVPLEIPTGYVTMRVTDMNESGQMVGYATTGDEGSQVAVEWSPKGVPTILPVPSGVTYAAATAITDGGIVVGWEGDADPTLQKGAVWQGGKIKLASDFTATPVGEFTYVSNSLKVIGMAANEGSFTLFQGS